MADNWYLARGGKKYGPYSLAVMQQMAGARQLLPTEMVLQEGTAKWVPAAEVKAFFSAPATAPLPPPLPSPPPSASPLPQAQDIPSLFEKLKEAFGKLKDLVKTIQEGHNWVVTCVVPASVFLPGMIGDFLRPIGPFNFVFFVFSSLLALSLIVLFVKRPKTFNYALGGTCALSAALATGFGFWSGLAYATGSKNKGFLANNIGMVDRMQASVIRGDSVVTEQPVEGDKLADEVRKHIEQEKDARKLFQYAFDGYPGNVIKAEVIGNPKKKPGAAGVYVYDLQVSVDVEQYETITRKRILPVLEKVALRKGEEFAKAGSVGGAVIYSSLFEGAVAFTDSRGGRPQEFPELKGITLKENKFDVDEMIVWVNTARSGSNDRTTWMWYVVPKASIFDRRAVMVDVIFQDKKQQELLRERIHEPSEGNPRNCQALPGFCGYMWSKPTDVKISAYILGTYGNGNCQYVPSLTKKMEINLTLAELEKLGSIRCSVKNSGGAE